MTLPYGARSSSPRRAPFQWGGALGDGLGWIVAVETGAFIGAESAPTALAVVTALLVGLGAAVVHLGVGLGASLYRGRYARGSFAEITLLGVVVLIAGIAVGVPVLVFREQLGLPRTTMAIAVPLVLLLLAAIRTVQRLRTETSTRRSGSTQPIIVFGAGWLGHNLVRVMATDPTSPYHAVGFIDDDPSLRDKRVDGVPVLGALTDLERVATATRASAIVVSIARADRALLRRVSDAAGELGLRVLVFPSLKEVLAGKSRLRDVRDIGIEDLIGRQPIDTGVESTAGYLRGKRVLVTGAGGSIGSELCRQISTYGPSQLIMLDRDETGLQGTQLLIDGNGLLMNDDIVLADIRDREALSRIFAERRPEVVFHAAALKHLPMLERFPEEAWKTNVLGTLNVLDAAVESGAELLVNISTDKAANSTSVLGHSKRLAERLTAQAAERSGRRYVSVRFGNVLGSRGSLVPVFASMIEAGGPLTVTDAEVTRFFMSIPEACHLVLQAGGIGGPGEVLILDMGEPVRILDIAQRMIAQSGKDIAIVFTGLREGEKLHEELVGEGESDDRPVHPKISHSRVPALAATELDMHAWLRELGVQH